MPCKIEEGIYSGKVLVRNTENRITAASVE